MLSSLRSGSLERKTFAFDDPGEDHETRADRNQQQRFRLLVALQFDPQPTDEALLQYLMEQEVAAHRAAHFQGLQTSLQTVAALLARFESPDNIPLYVSAKSANFDTHCGFDYQFLVSAGIDESYLYIDGCDDEDIREKFYRYMGPSTDLCRVDGNELEEFKGFWKSTWNRSLAHYTLVDQIYLADELGEPVARDELIAKWLNANPGRDEETLRTRQSLAGLRGDDVELLAVAEKLLDFQTEPWDRVSQLSTIAERHLVLHQPEQAWARLRAAQAYLPNIEDWQQVGLGRYLVERSFEVVIEIAGVTTVSKSAYAWACLHAASMPRLHLNALTSAIRAAEIMDDKEGAQRFHDLYGRERRRIWQS